MRAWGGGPCKAWWRGSSAPAGQNDLCHYRFDIMEYVTNGKAQNLETLLSQPSVTAGVMLGPSIHPVTFAVNFDHQPCRRTVEIDDIRRERMLATELQPIGSFAKHLPKQSFWQGHRAPQLACTHDRQVSISGRHLPLHHAAHGPPPHRQMGRNYPHPHAGLTFTFGAVAAYSAAVSHLLLSASASSNLSIVLTAHSSKLSLPSWSRSSLA